MSSGTFYPVHFTECGEFSAGNAWSSVMGLDRKPGDLSLSECLCVVADGEPDPYCETCGGTGWQDCLRGYSCCADPESLLGYFRRQAGEPQGTEPVVIFAGYQVGNDPDGEMLAIPEQVTETLTWAEFTARHAGEAR